MGLACKVDKGSTAGMPSLTRLRSYETAPGYARRSQAVSVMTGQQEKTDPDKLSSVRRQRL
jgi:hypothetical protein